MDGNSPCFNHKHGRASNIWQMRVLLMMMILILLTQPLFGCLNKHRCQGCSGPVSRKHKSKLIVNCRLQLPHNNIAATIRFCGEWISNRNAYSIFDKFIHRNSRCFKLRFIINSRRLKKLVNPPPPIAIFLQQLILTGACFDQTG